MVPWERLAIFLAAGLSLPLLWDVLSIWVLSSGSEPCRLDDEGSWSIGVFKGPSPLNLTPIEHVHPRADSPAAWPVANPVLSCASVTEPPSNFVADPFLFVLPNGSWYMFFETKTNTNMQGDIAVAESRDGGATWQYLGLALDEPWHLSYPFVFQWEGQVYMLPEGHASGALRLYRAVQFPLRWELEAVLLERPLVDTSVVEWEGRWWMFTSDPGRRGATPSGELEMYYADSPLGPWHPHALNPVMNGDRRAGARMGGRVLAHGGALLRFGQDCGATYGHRLVAYQIDRLTPTEFEQSLVHGFEFGQSRQGAAAWDGVRQHHIDAQQLPDGSWVAVMDGDWQPSGPISGRLKRAAAALAALWGVAACGAYLRAQSHRQHQPIMACCEPKLPAYAQPGRNGSPKPRGQQARLVLRAWQQLQQWLGCLGSSAAAAAVPGYGSSGERAQGGWGCPGVTACWQAACRQYGLTPGSRAARWAGLAAAAGGSLALAYCVYTGACQLYFLSITRDRPTAAQAVAVGGQLSKYTISVMTYFPRMATLRIFVQHYSKCPSLAEILIVWTAGSPPVIGRDLPVGLVPIRVRVESGERPTSLNNRHKPDPGMRTRAVLQLDDDTLLRCADVERAFAAWRREPQAMVGFYPRLIRTKPEAEYLRDAGVAWHGVYNAAIPKAAFYDASVAFAAYWKDDERYAAARAIVDTRFCDDILMNFVVAKLAEEAGVPHGRPTAVYVHPRRRLDISGLTSVGVSRSKQHDANCVFCIAQFERLFGGNPLRTSRLDPARDGGRPLCLLPSVGGCVYL